MKKVLVLLAMVLGASSMYGFEVDGILYNITSETNQTVEVTHKDFNGNYQGEIIIPESIRYNGKTYTVTAIGDNAFYNCYYMTSITIPKTIVSVGKYAFVDCIRIASVTLYCKTVGRWFSEISSIKNVVLGNGVESIEENAFLRCGITSLSIANTVNSIGKYAFSQCSMSALVIPSGVKTIGVYAFAGCNSLKKVEISNGVRTIANYAFFGCRKLRSVTIPPSVSSIGLGAFKECYDLRNVKMPESISKDKYSHSFEDETLLYITLYRPDNVESVEADINDAARGNVDDPITEEQSKMYSEALAQAYKYLDAANNNTDNEAAYKDYIKKADDCFKIIQSKRNSEQMYNPEAIKFYRSQIREALNSSNRIKFEVPSQLETEIRILYEKASNCIDKANNSKSKDEIIKYVKQADEYYVKILNIPNFESVIPAEYVNGYREKLKQMLDMINQMK
ncbi:hypothetical protein CIK96_07595 [Prevotella sp. P4-98]|uniref:leucine-rich repeat domain-containing protein n=1 Tax=Prevotella sp. P4-98 TaxID=2024219 RepID=UPI000B96CBD3|nr:leucine-rich repeat domain-containing protein [Prevotella sp. P4-98]OYP45788.1 hypothetical protein CIK96_07595 [Prevotella sp. P4-98]